MMLPIRQTSLRLARHLTHTPCRKCNAFFSTTTALGPRIRPGSRLPPRPVPGDQDQQAPQEHEPTAVPKLDKAPEPPKTPATSEPKDTRSRPIEAPDQDDAKKSSPKPKKKKSAAIRGLKPYQQTLYIRESICYQRGNDLPAEESDKTDRARLDGASKFFEAGCRLLYSAEELKHHARNDLVPEVVVLGASNAGKSSFLNALAGSVGTAAKVSHRPGKTTTMNAYGVGPRSKVARELLPKGAMPPRHSLVLMDTPGYGFKSRADWGATILRYLRTRNTLRGAVLLLPADKRLQGTDRWMLETLAHARTRTLVVLTKADKAGEEWPVACRTLATLVQTEMADLGTSAASTSREGSDRALDVYVTAANMGISAKLGNGAGLGGVRLAILEMAGFTAGSKVEQQAETKSYSGAIVSFDDIQWNTKT